MTHYDHNMMHCAQDRGAVRKTNATGIGLVKRLRIAAFNMPAITILRSLLLMAVHTLLKKNILIDMITEDYCSFEVAKLLKEKGFKEEVTNYYDSGGNFVKSGYKFNYNFQTVDHSAPTHQMAMKWLREEYGISIEISALKRNCWAYTIYKILNNKVEELYNDGEFKTYEETVETALKYSLENLI